MFVLLSSHVSQNGGQFLPTLQSPISPQPKCTFLPASLWWTSSCWNWTGGELVLPTHQLQLPPALVLHLVVKTHTVAYVSMITGGRHSSSQLPVGSHWECYLGWISAQEWSQQPQWTQPSLTVKRRVTASQHTWTSWPLFPAAPSRTQGSLPRKSTLISE